TQFAALALISARILVSAGHAKTRGFLSEALSCYRRALPAVLLLCYDRRPAGIMASTRDTPRCFSAVITAKASRARVVVGKCGSEHPIEPPYRVAFPTASLARRHLAARSHTGKLYGKRV